MTAVMEWVEFAGNTGLVDGQASVCPHCGYLIIPFRSSMSAQPCVVLSTAEMGASELSVTGGVVLKGSRPVLLCMLSFRGVYLCDESRYLVDHVVVLVPAIRMFHLFPPN